MKNILITIDFNTNEQKLMDMGSQMAAKFDSKIWLIHIAAPEPDFVPYTTGTGANNEREIRAAVLKKEHKLIQEYAAALNNKGINATGLLVQGQTIKTIMLEVKKLNIDLIITGNNNHGLFYNIFMESTSSEIIRKSKIPVLLVPLE